MSKCDIDHQLISFASKDCPLCRLRDDALDVVGQFEQLVCELEEIVRPAKKIGDNIACIQSRRGRMMA